MTGETEAAMLLCRCFPVCWGTEKKTFRQGVRSCVTLDWSSEARPHGRNICRGSEE